MERDEQDIRRLYEQWIEAVDSGKAEQVIALLHPDALFLLPGEPQAQAKETYAHGLSSWSGLKATTSCQIHEIVVAGDWAYCWNTISTHMTLPNGQKARGSGDTLSILKKLNGSWLVYRAANLMAGTSQ